MMFGLIEGQLKMSKSNPDSAIFMEDSAKEVERKINSAFCREGDIKENPVLDYTKHIVFGWRNSLEIKRKP
jgi:tyrosyl-tRNA synthetase